MGSTGSELSHWAIMTIIYHIPLTQCAERSLPANDIQSWELSFLCKDSYPVHLDPYAETDRTCLSPIRQWYCAKVRARFQSPWLLMNMGFDVKTNCGVACPGKRCARTPVIGQVVAYASTIQWLWLIILTVGSLPMEAIFRSCTQTPVSDVVLARIPIRPQVSIKVCSNFSIYL